MDYGRVWTVINQLTDEDTEHGHLWRDVVRPVNDGWWPYANPDVGPRESTSPARKTHRYASGADR